MAKQWLNEYNSGVSGTSRPVARVRLHRLNNLRSWRVEDVINTIPVLLQLALALFLAGLLILLWSYSNTVAAIASTLVGLLAVFTAVTTLLPLFNQSCSYLTPHIRTLHSLWQPKCFIFWLFDGTLRGRCGAALYLHTTQSQLLTFFQRLRWDDQRRFHRPSVGQIATAAVLKARAAGRCLQGAMRRLGKIRVRAPPKNWRDRKQTWQGRERSTIDQQEVNWDTLTLVEAYKITLHPDALSAATVCLMDFTDIDVIDYFRKLHKSAREHFGAAADAEHGPVGHKNQQQLLWLVVILCLFGNPHTSLEDDETTALAAYFKSGLWPSSMQAADAKWAVSTFDALMDHLEKTNRNSTAFDQERLQAERMYLIEDSMLRKKPLMSVLLPEVARTYKEVRRKESILTEASPDDAKRAHSGYLQSVNLFLQCAIRALASSLPANDLGTVRRYTRDVFSQLTGTLLVLFVENKTQTTLESTYLDDVMRTLSYLDNVLLGNCIPDDLIPDILLLSEILETTYDYVDNDWVANIQRCARAFKENIVRLKHKPGATVFPEKLPATLAAAEAVAVAEAIPHIIPSSSVANPGDDSPDEHSSDVGDALS